MAFTDDFDGELSEISLGDRVPSGGTAWTFISGLTDGMKVTTDGYVSPRRGTRTMYWSDNPGDADSYVKVYAVNVAPANDTGMCLRASGINNYWGCSLSPLTDQSELYKMVAGVKTVADTFTAGDLKEYVFEAVGNTLTVYENGVPVATTTDPFNNSSNRAGLISNASFSNYVLDSFASGPGTYQVNELVAQSAAVSGTGTITRNGTGVLEAQASTVFGISGANSTGSGALASAVATMAGTGQVNPGGYVYIGLVQLKAQSATIVGESGLVQSVTGTGELLAQDSTIVGGTALTRTGTGVLEADAAAIAGVAFGTDMVAYGDLVPTASSIYGTAGAVSNLTGIGQLRAGKSEVDGDGYRATIIYGDDSYSVWTKIN